MTKKEKYNSKKRKSEIEEKEALYGRLLEHIKYLKQVNKALKTIDADFNEMQDYYAKKWLDDYQHFERNDENYEILFEDPIFDSFQEIHAEKIKILKKIVKTLD